MVTIPGLQKAGRGAYAVPAGYVNLDRGVHLKILIRTTVCRGSRVRLRTGAAIVVNSLAARELVGTGNRARKMLLALGLNG